MLAKLDLVLPRLSLETTVLSRAWPMLRLLLRFNDLILVFHFPSILF